MKAKILVAGYESRADYYAPYLEAVRLAGGEPELRWPAPEMAAREKTLRRFLASYAGVLLPGGADIEPERYGEERHPKLGPTDHELDEVQLAIARILIKESIPALPICRGLQVVAVAAGASLYQDLPSQKPSDVNHRPAGPNDALAHSVKLVAGSRLAEICGAALFEVNSRHHQAVREGSAPDMIGPFTITAHAPDGVIEGLELAGHSFFVAVQWHPEDLAISRSRDHPQSRALFRNFVTACQGSVSRT